MPIRPKTLLTYSSGVLAIALLIAGLCQTFLNRSTDNQVATFYFTVHTTVVSYEEAEADYANAAARLQAEFAKALADHVDVASNNRQKRQATSDGPEVTVIGISKDDSDGVVAVSGVAYPRSSAPSTAELVGKINSIPNTVVVKTFDTASSGSGALNEALCSPTASGITSTTYHPNPSSTCPSCPTPKCPLPSSCPSCPSTHAPSVSTTTPSASTTAPSASTTAEPHTSEHPPAPKCTSNGLPNNVDVALYLGASPQAGWDSFKEEVNFVRHQLTSTWTINPRATEVELAAYGDYLLNDFYDHSYKYANNTTFYKDVDSLLTSKLLDGESLSSALMFATASSNHRRPGVKLVIVVFFHFITKVDVDTFCIDFARNAYANHSTIVLVGVGPSPDLELLNVLNATIVRADVLDDAVAAQINKGICATGTPLPYHYPPNSPRPTIPTTTLATKFGHLPCQADIVVGVDQSFAVGYDEYYREVLFIRDHLVPQWTIGLKDTEMVVFGYGKEKATFYRTDFTYPNDLAVFANLTDLKEQNLFDSPDFTNSIKTTAPILKWSAHPRPNSVVVTLSFTYTSVEVNNVIAKDDLKTLTLPGRKFIIVAMGNKYNESVLQKYSKNIIKSTKYTDNLASQISEEICKDITPPPPPTTTRLPPTTPSSEQPTITEEPSTTGNTSGDLPCKVDIGLLVDASREAGETNFNKQLSFVHHQLASRWSINPQSTEVNLIASGSVAQYLFPEYQYKKNAEFYSDVDSLFNAKLLNHESIELGLWMTTLDKEHRRPGVKHATVMFVYVTKMEDVQKAVKYANATHVDNSTLVFVGVGPLVNLEMLNVLHGFIIGTNALDDATAEKINAAICASGSPPPYQYSSPPPTLPTTTLATKFGHLPCQADIIVAVDKSHALSYAEYDKEVLFVRDKLVPHWTINPRETELAVFGYGRQECTCYHRYLSYTNDSSVFADLTRMKEEDLFDYPDLGMAFEEASLFTTFSRPKSLFLTIVFTYTSTISYPSLADPAFNSIISRGRKLIMVAMGNQYNEAVLRKYDKNFIKATEYSDTLADQISSRICTKLESTSTTTTAPIVNN